mmetsp:Transcript_56640/g.104857  ORF Transcript_56640/g.104857 Transcript_56640/m.104857 type:complete len:279 (-) Transcript_56640:124-960(-)
MEHLRCAMEELANSMPDQGANHTKAFPLCHITDGVANELHWCASFAHRYCRIQSLAGSIHQPMRVCIALTTHPCSGGVSMETIQVQRDIHIDNITILERPVVGNAMTDHFVHAYHDALWKAFVLQVTWVSAASANEVMQFSLQFFGGQARSNQLACKIQRSTRQFACTTHGLNLLFCLGFYLHIPPSLNFLWLIYIWRPGDVLGNLQGRRHCALDYGSSRGYTASRRSGGDAWQPPPSPGTRGCKCRDCSCCARAISSRSPLLMVRLLGPSCCYLRLP